MQYRNKIKGDLSRSAGAAKRYAPLAIIISLACAVIFFDFIFGDKYYIFTRSAADTLAAHWPTYSSISDFAKEGRIPAYTFYQGLGMNMFTNFWYLFDPFAWIFFIADKSFIPKLFIFVSITKMLCAGFSFSLFIGRFVKNRQVIIITSFLYAFNGYMMAWQIHIFVLTAVVYFPLLLWAFESYLADGKKLPLILSVLLFAVYNYFYLANSLIFLAVWAAARIVMSHKGDYRKWMKKAACSAFLILLGLGLSAVILLPVLSTYIHSNRVAADYYSADNQSVIRSLRYYLKFFSAFYSNSLLGAPAVHQGSSSYWESPKLYCGLLSLLALPCYFASEKKDQILKRSLILVCAVFSCLFFFTFGDNVMNVFASSHRRWYFVIIPVQLLICGLFLDSFFRDEIYLDKKILKKAYAVLTAVLIAECLYYSLAINNETIKTLDFIQITNKTFESFSERFFLVLFFITAYYLLLSLYPKYRQRYKSFVFLILVCIFTEICVFSVDSLPLKEYPVISKEYFTSDKGYYDGTMEIVDMIKENDDGFFRIEKDYLSNENERILHLNDSLMQKYYGTSSYASPMLKTYYDFEEAFGDMNLTAQTRLPNWVYKISKIPEIQSILSVKYFIAKEPIADETSYSEVFNTGDFIVYQNNGFIEFGSVFKKYIKESDFNELSLRERYSALQSCLVIQDEDEDRVLQYLDRQETRGPMTRTYEMPVLRTGGKAAVTENDGKLYFPTTTETITLEFELEEGVEARDVLISFRLTCDADIDGFVHWKYGNNSYTNENTGFFDITCGVNEVEMRLEQIDLSAFLLAFYGNQGQAEITDLKIQYYGADFSGSAPSEHLIITEFSQDAIDGDIYTEKNGTMLFPVPYEDAWKFKVGSETVKPFKVNVGLTGVPVKAGELSFEARYVPDLLLLGCAISMISLLFTILCCRRKGLAGRYDTVNDQRMR